MSSGAHPHAGFRSIEEIGRKLLQRYQRIWADELLVPGSTGWPYAIRVGRPTQHELERDYAAWDAEAQSLRLWAEGKGLTCLFERRRVGRVSYGIISHVQADDIRALSIAVGRQGHFEVYRKRAERLRREFAAVDERSVRRILVELSRHDATDLDFDLVCRAGAWFSRNEVKDCSAREVPLEGFHAKWLDEAGHRSMACALAGIERLELKERPRVVHFRYLDPTYLAGGGRVYDCWVEGDRSVLAYEPSVVIICENRDSALWFKPVRGGVAVQGDGMAGTVTIGKIPWIARCKRVFYWGDIDRQGFEILSKYREGGLRAQSLLMDADTYDEFMCYGTKTDRHGRTIGPKPGTEPLPGLSPAENELYLLLCSDDFVGPRRVEQERIPLWLAQRFVEERLQY